MGRSGHVTSSVGPSLWCILNRFLRLNQPLERTSNGLGKKRTGVPTDVTDELVTSESMRENRDLIATTRAYVDPDAWSYIRQSEHLAPIYLLSDEKSS